jgi:subtilisin family serine protease
LTLFKHLISFENLVVLVSDLRLDIRGEEIGMHARIVRVIIFLILVEVLLISSMGQALCFGAVATSEESNTRKGSPLGQTAMNPDQKKRDVSAISILDSVSGNVTLLSMNFGEVKVVSYQGSTYLVVDDKEGRNKLDSYLINMTYLYDNGYLARGDDRIGVIVQMSSFKDLSQAEGAVRNLNGTIHRMHSPHLPYVSATIPYANIHKLVSSHSIAKIWLNLRVHATLSESVPIIKDPTEWSSFETQLGAAVNGTGVTIAVIDTGIDSTHPDLAGKVVSSISFTGESPVDGFGHGTHCASIAAGTGAASGGLYKGVAPGASLMNVKVLTNAGWGYDSWIIEGIQWAVDHGARVLSMSFGASVNGDGTDPLSTTVDWAADQGAVPVVAAGNSGPYTFSVGTPAVAKKAITVGATTKTDGIASFSSRGPTLDWRIKPDVLAPGVNIVAARAAGTSMGSPLNEFYTSASGTSMATPHVSGAAALLLQINSTQTPEQIKARLVNSAVRLPLDVWVQGSGRIDCYQAATAQARLAPPGWSFGLVTSENAKSTSISLANLGNSSVSFTVSTETTVEGAPTDYVSASTSNGTLDGLQALAFNLTAGPFDNSTPEGWFEGWLKVEWLTEPAQTLHIPYFFTIMSLLDVTVLDIDGSPIDALITAASYPDLSPATSVYSSSPARLTVRSGDYAVFAHLGWIKNDYGRMFALERLVTVPRLSVLTVSLRLADANVSYIPTKSSAGQDLTVHAYVQMLGGGTPSGYQHIMQWETLCGRFGSDITTDKLTLYTTTYDPADKVSINLGFYASDALHAEVHLMPFKFWNVTNLPSVIAYPEEQLAVWDIFFDVPEDYPARGLRIMNAFWFTWDYTGGFQFWSWDIHQIYAGIRSKYYLAPNVQWPWICYMPTYADHEFSFIFGPLQEIHINDWTWPGPTGEPPATGQTGSISAGDFEFAPYTPGLALRASGGQVQITGDVWRELQWPRYDWYGGTNGCGGMEGPISPYPRKNPGYELRVDGATVAQGELSGGKYLNCSEADAFGADWTGINRTWTIEGEEALVLTTLPALGLLSSESSYTMRLDLSSGDADAPVIASLSYPHNYTLGQEIQILIDSDTTSGVANVTAQFSYDGITWNPASYETSTRIARFTVDYGGSDSIDLRIRVTDNSGNYVEFINRPAMLNARTMLTVQYPPSVPKGGTALIGGNLTTVAGNPIDKLALNFSSEPPSFYVLVDEGAIRQFSLNVPSRVQHTLTLFPVGLYYGEAVSFTIEAEFRGLAELTGFSDSQTGDVLMTVGDIAINPHGIKPSGVGYQQGRDSTPLGYIRGMLNNAQPCMFDTDAAIDVKGRPVGDWPLILTIGGPDINAVSHYYEHTGVAADRAPVTWSEEGSDVVWRYPNGTEVVRVTQASTAVPPGSSDVFVIQILRDADNRTVVLMYGERYTGTWAAAEYFKFHVYPNIATYTDSYYIVRWTDAASGTSANMMPDSGDTFTILAQGS